MFLTSFPRARRPTRPPPIPRESVSERSVPGLFPSAASCLQSLPLIPRRRGGSRSRTAPESGAARSPLGCAGSGSYCLKPPSCYKPPRYRSCLTAALTRPFLQSCVFPFQSCRSPPRSLGSRETLLDSDTQSQKGSDILLYLWRRPCAA